MSSKSRRACRPSRRLKDVVDGHALSPGCRGGRMAGAVRTEVLGDSTLEEASLDLPPDGIPRSRSVWRTGGEEELCGVSAKGLRLL